MHHSNSNSNNISSSIQSVANNGHVSNHFSGSQNTADHRAGAQQLPITSNHNNSAHMSGPPPKENGTDMPSGDNQKQFDRGQTPGTPGGPGSGGPSASGGSGGGSNNLIVGNVMIPNNLLPVKVETAAEIQAAAKRRTQSCSAIQQIANNSQIEPQSPISKVCAMFNLTRIFAPSGLGQYFALLTHLSHYVQILELLFSIIVQILLIHVNLAILTVRIFLTS